MIVSVLCFIDVFDIRIYNTNEVMMNLNINDYLTAIVFTFNIVVNYF